MDDDLATTTTKTDMADMIDVALLAAEANALTTAYLQQMTPLEQTVLKIAQSHLESSFSLEHSLGYIAWLHQQRQAASGQKQ
jgi:hypothetical protein